MTGQIFSETSPSPIQHGHTTTVAGEATPLTTRKSIVCRHGILVRNLGANDVWIGSCVVTADSNATSGGYVAHADEPVMIPASDPSQVFVNSATGGEDIAWMGL